MRRIAIGILLLLACASIASARSVNVVVGQGTSAAAGQTFSDNFDRSDSDNPGSWTEEAGDWDIASNVLSLATGSYDYCALRYNTQTDTVNQYAKVTMGPASDLGAYPSILLRYNNTSSPFYKIHLQGYYGDVSIIKCDNLADFETGTTLETDDLGTSPLTLGVTISGTATTTIRVWVNPTGDAPTSATEWGGDSTPNLTAADSSSPITTYRSFGLGGYQGTAGWSTWNNWTGGDIP